MRVRPAEDASCVWSEVQGGDMLPGLSSSCGVGWKRGLDGVGEGADAEGLDGHEIPFLGGHVVNGGGPEDEECWKVFGSK